MRAYLCIFSLSPVTPVKLSLNCDFAELYAIIWCGDAFSGSHETKNILL